MSEVCFCRTFRFRARHHYQVAAWSEAENKQAFGDASVPHEHHWALTIYLSGPIDPETGMVVDLLKVDEVMQRVAGCFEGRSFREVNPYFEKHQPTTEVLAKYFAERIQAHFPGMLRLVRVAEAEDLFAEWRP